MLVERNGQLKEQNSCTASDAWEQVLEEQRKDRREGS